MNTEYLIDGDSLINNLNELGNIGRDNSNNLTRLEATLDEKKGRDKIVSWMKDMDLEVKVDKIGNIFGIWEEDYNSNELPIMMGSHIDSVSNAGIYDGCYGVISGLEVIRKLKKEGCKPKRPLVVGVFTNEEGVRYQPDMLGSLVYVGGLSLDEALKTEGIDGSILGEELEKIGYLGEEEPGFIKPYAFIELHIEQGPILDHENVSIGVVEAVQGISWNEVTIEGEANHAGTTPIKLRTDAGLSAAKLIMFLRELANDSNDTTVTTVGSMELYPNLINVIPSKAIVTVDIRNSNLSKFNEDVGKFKNHIKKIEKEDNVKISVKSLANFNPVPFDKNIINKIENAIKNKNINYKKMTSGAGHDAQMLARICPTAMIFVPSIDGISHNPNEFTKKEDLISGANILLDVVLDLSND